VRSEDRHFFGEGIEEGRKLGIWETGRFRLLDSWEWARVLGPRGWGGCKEILRGGF